MQQQVYERICALVYDEAGIRIRPGKESMVASRLAKRVRALGLESETDYLEYLERELATEVVALLDVISTNVTSFYRESEHFKVLADSHRQLLRAGAKRVRYWCAASSTGEEPYTIAMTLAEVERELGARPDCRLLATDISTRVLKEASDGAYNNARMAGVPEELRKRYFARTEIAGVEMHRAIPELSSRIMFRRLNLSQPPFPMRGPLDAVFCRNVMFYFDEPVKEALVAEFHRLLKPGGLLFVGKSESLPPGSPGYVRAGSSVFRKVN
ncbi:MAG: methyltransferase domain-containing protein [Planctomycetaceae bacterium]|nr:methyltransferase domain-containing protein [Planctomycetaceae bacterium]